MCTVWDFPEALVWRGIVVDSGSAMSRLLHVGHVMLRMSSWSRSMIGSPGWHEGIRLGHRNPNVPFSKGNFFPDSSQDELHGCCHSAAFEQFFINLDHCRFPLEAGILLCVVSPIQKLSNKLFLIRVLLHLIELFLELFFVLLDFAAQAFGRYCHLDDLDVGPRHLSLPGWSASEREGIAIIQCFDLTIARHGEVGFEDGKGGMMAGALTREMGRRMVMHGAGAVVALKCLGRHALR